MSFFNYLSKCYPLDYLQEYVNTYVSIPETEVMVNDQMAAYEERELNVISFKCSRECLYLFFRDIKNWNQSEVSLTRMDSLL